MLRPQGVPSEQLQVRWCRERTGDGTRIGEKMPPRHGWEWVHLNDAVLERALRHGKKVRRKLRYPGSCPDSLAKRETQAAYWKRKEMEEDDD
eukprot:NODE_23106_length_680_cov_3.547920.p3 GENE.NODE_23106_length_680_cov_3.547920~~NODE_23106_length_680_cov_3.547920.p3  ORF type:complete len:108 (-),score=31.43 NODE_23106_length_680_cov_3.547920:357-632(-)